MGFRFPCLLTNTSNPMKTVRVISVIIGFLLVLLFIVPLLLPSESEVERSIVIERPREVVFTNLLDFNIYRQWNPWSAKEPASTHEISGQPGMIGHSWTWNGEEIGNGTLTIKQFHEFDYIENILEFKEPMQTESQDIWRLDEVSEGTKVTWINKSPANYPLGRYFGLMMDNWLGQDFEDGLANLKNYLENN